MRNMFYWQITNVLMTDDHVSQILNAFFCIATTLILIEFSEFFHITVRSDISQLSHCSPQIFYLAFIWLNIQLWQLLSYCAGGFKVDNGYSFWSYSGPYFPAFGLNTERYGVSFCNQLECGKINTRITPNPGTFHVVRPY